MTFLLKNNSDTPAEACDGKSYTHSPAVHGKSNTYLSKYVECMEYLVYITLAASAFLYFLLSTRLSGPDMFRLKFFAKMAKFLLANIQYKSMVYRERF